MNAEGPDALATRLAQVKTLDGVERLRAVNAWVHDWVFSDASAAAALVEETLAYGRTLGAEVDAQEHAEAMAETRRLGGVAAFYLGKPGEAAGKLEAALESAKACGALLVRVNALNNLAMVSRHVDDLPRALDFYEEALAAVREVGNPTWESNTLGNIGILYYKSGDLEQSQHYIEAALNRALAVGDGALEMFWSNNLAEVHLARDQAEAAKPLLDRALALSEERGEKALRCDALRNFAAYHRAQEEAEAAKSAGEEALALAEAFEDRELQAEILLDLADAVRGEGTAVDGEDAAAVERLGRALRLAEEVSSSSLQAKAHAALARRREAMGDFPEALGHMRRYAEIALAGREEDLKRKLRQQQGRFEQREMRRDLERERAVNSRLRAEVARRTAAEAEVRRALKQVRLADEVKARFLAMISHEIRTPMNGIVGMADLLRQTDLDAEQEEGIAIIIQAAKNLLHVINDILDVSQLEGGLIEAVEDDFSLGEIIENARQEVGPALASKSLELTCDFPSKLRGIYRGDARRLRQILWHLLDNAVKFTESGQVNLVVRRAGVGRLRFIVSDTGIGIDASMRERIFEMFVLGDSSSTREHCGAGLGLTIGRKLAERMGGALWVESTPGTGSQFFLELPLPRFAMVRK